MGGAAQEDLADRMACPKKGARGVVAVYKPSGSEIYGIIMDHPSH